MSRPLILITNDDGYFSRGIKAITEVAKKYGDVVVVAPNGPRSAQSSALTIEVPVQVRVLEESTEFSHYITSGTPADCVKLAVSQLLHRKPDLLISGVNHGSNASINVLYSGTIGAALEGSLHGVHSLAFSLCDHHADADFDFALPFFENIIVKTLREGLPIGVSLNINAPVGAIKGVKACRQADGRWANDFMKTQAPRTNDYYWLIGDFSYSDKTDMSADQTALDAGYISIVPLHVDLTHYKSIELCKRYEE